MTTWSRSTPKRTAKVAEAKAKVKVFVDTGAWATLAVEDDAQS
jgi:hypothetical protein